MTAFTVREPADFVALTPIVLGFQPENSIVMVTMQGFCARMDVPPAEHVTEVVQTLLGPAQRHNITQAAFLVFNDEDNTDLMHSIFSAFGGVGIDIVAALEVRDGQYRQFSTVDWIDVDVRSHPFTLEMQVAGAAPFNRTREGMWDDVRPRGLGWDASAAEAVEELRRLGPTSVVASLHRENRSDQAALWRDALRGSREGTDEANKIAIVTAYAFWILGQGATAWQILDNAPVETPLHEALAMLLHNAVNPADWQW